MNLLTFTVNRWYRAVTGPRRILPVLGILLSLGLSAQKPSKSVDFYSAPLRPATQTEDLEMPEKKEKSDGPHLALGAGVGTNGYLNAGVFLGLNRFITLRTGYNLLNFDITDLRSNLAGLVEEEMLIDGQVRQTNAEVLLELGIARGAIRLVGGISYAFQNQFYGDFQLAENFQFNDVVFTPEEIGSAGATLTYPKNWAPYFGLGLGRTIPKHRFSLCFDFGAYYKGSPEVDIQATGIFRSNDSNEAILNRNLSRDPIYQFWPVVSGKLTCRIF